MKYFTINNEDFNIIKSLSYKIKNYNEDTFNGFILFYFEYKNIIYHRMQNRLQTIIKLIELWNKLPINSKFHYITNYYEDYQDAYSF